jgi:hypothetical protein
MASACSLAAQRASLSVIRLLYAALIGLSWLLVAFANSPYPEGARLSVLNALNYADLHEIHVVAMEPYPSRFRY